MISDHSLFMGLVLIWGAVVAPVAISIGWDLFDAWRRFWGR